MTYPSNSDLQREENDKREGLRRARALGRGPRNVSCNAFGSLPKKVFGGERSEWKKDSWGCKKGGLKQKLLAV